MDVVVLHYSLKEIPPDLVIGQPTTIQWGRGTIEKSPLDQTLQAQPVKFLSWESFFFLHKRCNMYKYAHYTS